MADAPNPVTLPMVRIVKRCQQLTVVQKWVWMDLYPYYRQGCWQTAAAQGLAIGLGEDVVDRTRRLLEQVGLARRGVLARQGRMGRPGHSWFAAFPDIAPGLGRKISDDDVARLSLTLDHHIEACLAAPETRIGIRLSQRKSRATRAETNPPPEAGNARPSAGGASRGKGDQGVGLSFDLQGECLCSSTLPEEGQSPTETKEGQEIRSPKDSLEPTDVVPDQGFSSRFTRTPLPDSGTRPQPHADFEEYLTGWLGRARGGGPQ